jgi:signal transduction histidine kinase
LLALTEVTGRMAQGDLSARAEAARPAPAEVGLLAHSFNEMAEQVEETVLALRRFVADAAHELHTPLTALRTNLELIAGKPARTFRSNRPRWCGWKRSPVTCSTYRDWKAGPARPALARSL